MSDAQSAASPPSLAGEVFSRDGSDRVWVAGGYGITLAVERGHLVLRDGVGEHRRTRKVPRVDRTLRRVVIIGREGYLTLAALRWCKDHAITITTLDGAGELTASWSPESGRGDARLIRCQALSGADGPCADTGLAIGRQILSAKTRAQADIIRTVFGKPREAEEILACTEKIATAETMAKLREHEAHCALWYFGTWTGRVAIPWHRRDIDGVPANWCHYPGRRSLIGDKKRHATDPVNAMLNFCYTLGYTEARTACIGAGLDPRMGYFHNDDAARDSLALDVLEAVRPEIDRYILGLLGLGGTMRTFTPRDFSEQSAPYFPGTCRITAPLTHELAERSTAWSRSAASVASDIVRSLLAIPVGGRDTIRPARSVSRVAGQGRFPMAATVRQIVPERAWRVIHKTIPPRAQEYGRTMIDDRTAIAGIAWCMGNGVKYGKVPASLGIQGSTLRRRMIEWQTAGAWDNIVAAITETVLA